jgi:triphosphatase
MDQSVGAERINAALPVSFPETAKLPRARKLDIKFRTNGEGLKLALRSDLLATHITKTPRRTLRSVYFDTFAGDLRKEQMFLRVRKARNTHVMGLNRSGPLDDGTLSTGQIDVRVSSLTPTITLFGEEIAAELSRVINGHLLERKFESQIKRRLFCLNLARSLIEVAFDEGFILAGDRRQPLTEIGLELKAGEETALYDFAVHLADALPIRLEIMSEAERGFLLAEDDRPLPVRAPSLQFSKDATLDSAIDTVIASVLGQFVANWPAFTETRHSESIHQMRVALRRLRAALALFNHLLPCAEFGNLRAEAKQIAAALAPARDLDAFRQLVETGPLIRYADEEESFKALLTAVEERRVAAYAIAQKIIDDPSTTRFVLKLRAFLAHRAWRNALSGTELLRLTEPAALFAYETLEWLHRRALKRGRKLLQKPPEERHRVRIALKNIRYAAEFFNSLFGGARAYVRAVSNLQDGLGAFNDVAGATHHLRDVEAAAGPQAAKAAGSSLAGAGEAKSRLTRAYVNHGSHLSEPVPSGAE